MISCNALIHMIVLLFAFYFCLVTYRSELNFFRGDYYGCIIGRRHASVVSSISMFLDRAMARGVRPGGAVYLIGRPVGPPGTMRAQRRVVPGLVIGTDQGCGAGAGAGAGAAGADRFWSEPEPEPEPPKRFARSRSRSRSRQKRGGSGSEKGYNCGKKKQNDSEITRNSRTNSLPKFYISNFRTSAINYLKFS